MKDRLKFRVVFFAVLSVFLFTSFCQKGNAQDAKKNKIRLKADYVKIMDDVIYFDISATAKVDNKNINLSNINLTVYNEFEDTEIELGKTTTNMHGKSRFVLKDLNSIQPDSTNTYNIVISFEGNDSYSRASKSLSFKNAYINAKIIVIDGINYITATLTDASADIQIIDGPLNVQVQRLFSPLRIGEEFYTTDEKGSILVPIEEGIPGIDGNLIIEVVLNDSDDYGTVKALVNAPIGIPIVDESTFDERTMWSPPNKAPLFLLVTSNLLILGVWGFIVYLITNLFKIYNTKI